jgi:hypothetical protein
VNQAKPQPLLQTNHVLGANRIRAPERLVEILAIPAAKLRRAMVDVVKRTAALKDAFQLPEFAHIAARIQRYLDVGTETETNFVRLVVKIARDNVMPSSAQLGYESRADRSQSTGYKDAHLGANN